jgi:hypothetical protein
MKAARGSSEFYETVSVVERDELPQVALQRKGIPQGRHVHAFMSGGSQVLSRLFPGLLDEMAAGGANVWDDGDLSRVCFRFGRYEFKNCGRFADPAASATYLASRPFLETHVRRFLRYFTCVAPVSFSLISSLTRSADRGRETGVRQQSTGAPDVRG